MPTRPWAAVVFLVCAALSGCASPAALARHDAAVARYQASLRSESVELTSGVSDRLGAVAPDAPGDAARLDRDALIAAVLQVNPEIDMARHAWEAALARFPQSRAWEDPMVMYGAAPLSAAGHRFGQEIAVSQAFPILDRLDAAGERALAGGEAAEERIEVVRLDLAVMAAMLWDEYFAVERSREVVLHHLDLMAEIREAAEIQYGVGRASQQDALQAEFELVRMQQDLLMLDAERGVIVGRINGLLHRAPESPLPEPPTTAPTTDLPEAGLAALVEEALANRPELAELQARLRESDAMIAEERSMYRPMFGVGTAFSTMWDDPMHRWMVNVNVSVPLQQARRDAAVEEAQAMRLSMDAELASVVDRVRVEVYEHLRRVQESQALVALIEGEIEPTASYQLEAARLAYEANLTGFMEVIEAENNLRQAELDRLLALAQLQSRSAQLERALGRIPGRSEREARVP